MANSLVIRGQLVDIPNKRIYGAELTLKGNQIISITETGEKSGPYIMPGFIDAHIHIESSMLVPSEFARVAVKHGTVATISDPHEIANVLGSEGVQFMVDNGKTVPFKFHFGAPSCVPATSFETAGAIIDSDGIKDLLASPDIYYLAEMMNYPGVLHRDEEVMKKLYWAKYFGKPVDGHAPGLINEDARNYIEAGITTDHECVSLDEAKGKLRHGMKILIREGSAAKNFDALIPLLNDHFDKIMFCSDDKHPDDLIDGHINDICARALEAGEDLFKVLQAACINPIGHYNMSVGQLRIGDPADFIVVEDLVEFKVIQTYIEGNLVFDNGQSLIEKTAFDKPNNFNIGKISERQLLIPATSNQIHVIEALDGQLITGELIKVAKVVDGYIVSDIQNDLLKIAVINRYAAAPPAVAFIHNFGLKKGAIASSVAHDCHNIVAVGTNDTDMANAINLIINSKGGISAVDGEDQKMLPLPIAGIISEMDGWQTAEAYKRVDQMAKDLGSKLRAPFMTLSFMALLVIPDLKLSDKGLFSGKNFSFKNLYAD